MDDADTDRDAAGPATRSAQSKHRQRNGKRDRSGEGGQDNECEGGSEAVHLKYIGTGAPTVKRTVDSRSAELVTSL